MKKLKIYPVWLFALVILNACQKSFLEKKQNKSLLIPETLEDFDALLDDVSGLNENYPSLNYIVSDDFFIDEAGFQTLSDRERGAYIWDGGLVASLPRLSDWNNQYNKVFIANIVLDGISELELGDQYQSEKNRIKGSALFYRAYTYYCLSQVFCAPYSSNAPDGQQGLYIRLEPDVINPVPLSNLSDLYDRILTDLLEAEELLPVNSIYKTRPNKRAVQALLARIYLDISDYENAKLYAERCLNQNSDLIDYRSLDTALQNPFPMVVPNGNNEVIFYSTMVGTFNFNTSSLVSVDTLLFSGYETGDLRRAILFTNRTDKINSLTGNYSGDTRSFNGLANDELLLIRAECSARQGNIVSALDDLNFLLSHRFDESFSVVHLTEQAALLERIILERRRELIGRGLRWTDIRRLHREEQFKQTLVRNVGGMRFELSAEQQPFVFAIPYYESEN